MHTSPTDKPIIEALTPAQLDQALRDGLRVEYGVTDSFYFGPLGKTFITGWFIVSEAHR